MAIFGDRYELVRQLGAGGMGEVWLAHDEELAGRPVAIKIMHKHMLLNSGDVARFEREMRFAAMMDHPNIVTVYTTGTCDGAPFMVMEYLRGHDLEQVLPGGDGEHIAAIGRDICNGLAYAHREGVLHRDIKPANLFLCESGPVKITDFGVARAVDGTSLSTIGVVVGTLAYLPPERWRGEPPAFGNDIWAVGCVLYRLISGRLPRVLPDVADYAAAAARGDSFPDLRDISSAPRWLTGPVMAMLADDPASRPSASECVQLLTSAQFPVPGPGLPLRSRHLPGQLDDDTPEPASVGGAARKDPVTTPVTRPDAPPGPAAARSRRHPDHRGVRHRDAAVTRPGQARGRRPVIGGRIPCAEQPLSIAAAVMIRMPNLLEGEVSRGDRADAFHLRKEMRVLLTFLTFHIIVVDRASATRRQDPE